MNKVEFIAAEEIIIDATAEVVDELSLPELDMVGGGGSISLLQ